MVEQWMLDKLENWSTEKIKNWIWMNSENGFPIPGCLTVEALRYELTHRGEDPAGYHNT